MVSRLARSMTILGAVAQLAVIVPYATPAAQRRDGFRADRHRIEQNRRERERDRRRDAKTDGIVAGVVGTAVLATITAAAASSNKNEGRDERADYCRDRYGNYDRESNGYRASDGRTYPCE